jgi:hypothetical protein
MLAVGEDCYFLSIKFLQLLLLVEEALFNITKLDGLVYRVSRLDPLLF